MTLQPSRYLQQPGALVSTYNPSLSKADNGTDFLVTPPCENTLQQTVSHRPNPFPLVSMLRSPSRVPKGWATRLLVSTTLEKQRGLKSTRNRTRGWEEARKDPRLECGLEKPPSWGPWLDRVRTHTHTRTHILKSLHTLAAHNSQYVILP